MLFVVLVDKTVRLVEVGATVEFTVLPMVEELLTFASVEEMASVAVDELLGSPVVFSVVLVSLTAGPIDTAFALVLSIVLDGANVELTFPTIDEGLLAVPVLVDGCKEMELELPFVGPVGPPAEPFADVDAEEGDDVVLTYVFESVDNTLDVLKEEFTEMVLLELDPMAFVLATVGVVIFTSVEEPCITEETWLLELLEFVRRVDVDAILVVDCVGGFDDGCFEDALMLAFTLSVLGGTVDERCCDVGEKVLDAGELDGELGLDHLGLVGGASVVAAVIGVATV